ncbi:hypothetical protein B0H14DRAFT_3731739 [Mycena olivaceomarginata]|nr:hypothetical protein B0H14DRAFT_3731739 [Mycena olivaceomarginata]
MLGDTQAARNKYLFGKAAASSVPNGESSTSVRRSLSASLSPYDEDFNANCLRRTYQHLRFLNTGIGQAVRALNSTLGVTSDVVQTLIDNSIQCPGCSCQYSLDGFDDHIQDGHCGNRPEAIPVSKVPAESRPSLSDLENRQLPLGKCLGTMAEFLDFPIGAALLEWNSRLGIPTDVWAVASTAMQEVSLAHTVGSPRPPATLANLIRNEGLHWPCFCSIVEHRPVSTYILFEGDECCVYCGHQPPRCSYFLHLNSLYCTSTLTREYTLPLRSFAPYSTSVLSSFLLEAAKVFRPFGPQSLTGYLGDYDADVIQRGQFHHRPLFTTELRGRLGPRHYLVEEKTYTDIGVQTDPTGLNVGLPAVYGTPNEIRIMLDLFAGNFINGADVLQLLKRCSRCRRI